MACSLSNWAGSGTAPKIIADSGAKSTMDDKTLYQKFMITYTLST